MEKSKLELNLTDGNVDSEALGKVLELVATASQQKGDIPRQAVVMLEVQDNIYMSAITMDPQRDSRTLAAMCLQQALRRIIEAQGSVVDFGKVQSEMLQMLNNTWQAIREEVNELMQQAQGETRH